MTPIEFLIFHYGEIATKSGNRLFFEKTLAANIARILAPFGVGETAILRGRIVARVSSDCDLAAIRTAVKFLFGVEYVLFAVGVRPEFDAIKSAAVAVMRDAPEGTFKAETLRADKSFPMNSMEVNAALGAAVIEATGRKVDVRAPQVTCSVEILNGRAFVAAESVKGPGGLPTGTQSPVLVLLSGGIDSPVSALELQKRGARVAAVHFHSYPQTSRASEEKVKDIAKIIARAQGNLRLFSVPFLDIQKATVMSAPPELRVVLYRRSMYRIAAALAERGGFLALGNGESLGQVASQTLENMAAVNAAVSLPVLRPLVTMNKNQTIELADEYGTLEISNRPHEDCCSLFLPEHPETRAKIGTVLEAESRIIGLAGLEAKALSETETHEIRGV